MKKDINNDLKKYLSNGEWRTPYLIQQFLDITQENFIEKYGYSTDKDRGEYYLTIRNELNKLLKAAEKAFTSDLTNYCIELEEAKNNVRKMLDNPNTTIDFHSIEYRAKRVDTLREEINGKL